MAVIIPIRGLRYNMRKVDNMADVVTPPYDVIDAAAQDRFYRRHPCNIIRLEYGKIDPEDSEINNRYTRAANDYSDWLKENVLAREPKPAIYLYEQEFKAGGANKIRSGIICGVRLEPYEKGIVLPHEETIPKHKADRLELMRACGANFSPVFSLYSDQDNGVVETLKGSLLGAPPDISFTDDSGESHRMWVVTDADAIGKVQRIMKDKRIFIADGHHRYETALNYKKERENSGGERDDAAVSAASSCTATPGGTISSSTEVEPAYNYVMMTLVNLYDPGLVVLPTHRLIKNVESLDKYCLLDQIKDNFTVEEFQLEPDKGNFRQLLGVLERRGLGEQSGGDVKALETAGAAAQEKPGNTGKAHRHAFGLYAGDNKFYLLTLKDDIDLSQMMPEEKSPAWQRLDVSILHTLIMEKHLGICGELRAKADHITYTREEEGALAAVDRGEYQLVFFLNPTLVEEVTEVAGQGEKMPQKSTFFYPKLITGLVINQL
ncbi:DUF1015 domain-containing protein [Pelotomaculum propionicicum]|uniref:DUF1015 domain-containing protein n=1 Tax=Pelotomaculum propionicicum TaxID=258475 RepID=UPI003B7E1236